MSIARTLARIAILLPLLDGCTPPTSSCVPGMVVACPCAGDTSGVQSCRASGTFGPCECAFDGGDPHDAQPDHVGTLDVVDTAVESDSGDSAVALDGVDSSFDADDEGPSDAPSVDGASDAGREGELVVDPWPCGRFPTPPTLPAGFSALVDLGHVHPVNLVRIAGDRVLSRDQYGHWVLWNTADQSQVANGNQLCAALDCTLAPMDMAGTTIEIASAASVELRSRVDAHVMATIATPTANSGLSSDGSYFWAATTTSVTAWNSDGSMRFSRAGNYSGASIFAAPTELRLANGPSGATTIEHLDASTGSSSASPPFSGAFGGWFLDGGRFFAVVGTTVAIYNASATREAFVSLPSVEQLTGQGDYFWTYQARSVGRPLDVYSVATGASVLHFSPGALANVVGSSGAIGVFGEGSRSFQLIRLSPSFTNVTEMMTAPSFSGPTAFASDADGRWVTGTGTGVVTTDTLTRATSGRRALSCGVLRTIDGSASGALAMSALVGGTILADLGTSTPAVRGAIPLASSRVAVSSDGSIVAASASDMLYDTDRSLYFYSFPGGSVAANWPYAYMFIGTRFMDYDMSRSGTRVAQLMGTFPATGMAYQVQLTNLTGSTTVYSERTGSFETPRLSPNGSLMALPSDGRIPGTSARIIRDGVLYGAADGYPVLWLDDDHLLMNVYSLTRWGTAENTTVVDPTGAIVLNPPMPEMPSAALFSATAVYSPRAGAAFDTTSGAMVWHSSLPPSPIYEAARPTRGAVAGSYVISLWGTTIVAEPR